jgi:dipeptidyl aminopeptidase/acylaminoacyl peptidase
MISKRIWPALSASLLASIWMLASPGAADAETPTAGPPPLSAFGHLPSIEQAVISPAGDRLAVIYTDGEARKVVFVSVPDLKVTGVLNGGSQKIRSIQWAGSNHLLITVSHAVEVADLLAPKSEWSVTTDYNLTKKTLKPVLDHVPDAMNVTLDTPVIRILDGHPYAFIQGMDFVNNHGRIGLFKVDLDRDSAVLLETGFDHTRDWVVDQAGQPLAELEEDSTKDVTLVRVKRHGVWRMVKLGDKDSSPSLMGLGRDGKAILFGDNIDDKDALRELAVDGEDWGSAFAHIDNLHALFDPGDDHLLGTYALNGDHDEYAFFSPHDQAIWNAVTKAYPGARVTLTSWSADHSKLVVYVDSPTDGPAYAYVDIASGKGSWISGAYDATIDALATQTPIAFKASDGTPITGYLTLPKGKPAKNLPLVVFPHGGPAARDEPGFDWWAQAMASRGYAVLQVNYRGSEGFGWKFLSSGFGQWGRAMQTDLSDGVRALAVQGKIDPRRVCIVGASYGGYAALAGATLQPEVYRCAASIAGPAELRKFVAWSREQSDISAQRYWLKFMGAENLKDVRLEDISPADHADQVSGPVLLIHGKDDTVVPFNQSQLMADALKKAGKPYDFVVLKAEDHWLSRGETRLQMLQAVMDFLQKNNPPG